TRQLRRFYPPLEVSGWACAQPDTSSDRGSMGQYIIRRIAASLPVLIGVVLVTFALARMIPGGPCVAMLGEKATQAACARFDREKGFDRPIPVQLVFYIRDVLTGDLGTSIRFNRAVT